MLKTAVTCLLGTFSLFKPTTGTVPYHRYRQKRATCVNMVILFKAHRRLGNTPHPPAALQVKEENTKVKKLKRESGKFFLGTKLCNTVPTCFKRGNPFTGYCLKTVRTSKG